jgi:hypothetical protein
MAGFAFEDQAQALGRGYTASGFQGAIRSWAASLEKLAASGLVVYLYALLDDNDRAFAWLMKGLQQKTYSMPFSRRTRRRKTSAPIPVFPIWCGA